MKTKYNIENLKKISTKPGVYLMKNCRGVVIYVGKAKNLRQRVKQYFSKHHDGRFMVPYLVSHVTSIDTIVVSSEKEALLLENNLIKKHQPKYNVLLKDDKTYIALQINHKHAWPMVKIVRYRGQPKKGALYFGPYTSAGAARKTLDLINRVFPLRQCSDQELKRRTRPCILHGMKRCSAPCVNFCTKEEYQEHVERAIKFLKGQDKEVLGELKIAMQRYSDQLEFEKAQEVLHTIQQIEKTVERQHVDKPLGIDCDALAIYREGSEITLCLMIYQKGRLLSSYWHQFPHTAQEDEEIYHSFILQHYQEKEELPHEILLPIKLKEAKELSEILSEEKKRKTKVLHPTRGEKVQIVALSKENAEASFNREKDQELIRERTLIELQEKLKLTRYPRLIECFDNSNISGDEPVSSLVVFVEGKKEGKSYRKYKIKTAKSSPDDYQAMYEVLTRRYRRAKEEQALPDLLIVDGGKGHLNVALRVMEELDITTVDVIGVAKEEGRHDRGITREQVFLPYVKDPILLKQNSQVLFLLQRIRDEAHRTALQFHKKRRSKKTIKSELDQIPGVGVSKRNALLKHFGSVKRIKEVTVNELEEVKGIHSSLANKIMEYFK